MKCIYPDLISDIDVSSIALTGTLTFTEGSKSVSGVGTDFVGEISVGDQIQLDADGVYVEVASIASVGGLTLATVYETLTGIMTFTNGSATVTGSGTAFTTEATVGDYIILNADLVTAMVTVISSDTQIVLTANYTGTGGTGNGSRMADYTGAGGSGVGSIVLENSNYPITNVQDEYPKNVFKSTATSVTVTITVPRGDSVAIFNTNADLVTFEAKTTSLVTTLDGPDEFDLTGVTTYYELITDTGTPVTQFWWDYEYQSSEHVVEITLTGSTTVEVGVIRAGTGKNFVDPQKGLREGMKDYSITRELNNGAFYYRKRDIVRTFAGSLMITRDRDFYNFMHGVFELLGPEPVAWKVSSNLSNADWAVFARFASAPSGSHNYHDDSVMNFSLIEAV
jgi:hypothetical protein